MSALVDDLASRAAQVAAALCWRQWRALAGAGLPLGQQPVGSIVDPEALVLTSLAVRGQERRLDDQLRWWAEAGAWLMSVQRMRTLLGDFPTRVRAELGWFAARAVEAGDPRWRVFVGKTKKADAGRPGKGPRELLLLEPATLMLRLRAGLGVGAKADLLTFLIGAASRAGAPVVATTAEVIAKAISYSIASTRRAASEMVVARLVDASADRPVTYATDVAGWAGLLRLVEPAFVAEAAGMGWRAQVDVPPWRFWAQMLPFLAACAELSADAAVAKAAPVVQASRMRDLAERFRRPLAWNGIEWIDPRRFPGERYAEAFARLADSVGRWVAEKG